MSDYKTPDDEHPDFWLPQHEDSTPVGYPPYTFTWDDELDEEHEGRLRGNLQEFRKYAQDFWDEIKRILPALVEQVLGATAEALHPSRFGLFLMLLSFLMVFRLTYPLYSAESTNTFKVLDAEGFFIGYSGLFVGRETSYPEEDKLSAASQEALDEFRHYLGVDGSQDRDWEKAKQAISQAIAVEPDVSNLYLLRASFLVRRLDDFDGATRDYTSAIDLDSTLPGAFLGRGYCHFRKGSYPWALRDLDTAIQLDQDPRAYLVRGTVYELLGLYKSALKDYTASIEGSEFSIRDEESDTASFPDYLSSLFFRRGYTYLRLKDWDACVADFDMYMEVDWGVIGAGSAPMSVYLNRGECLTHLGRYGRALADYQFVSEYYDLDLNERELSWVRDRIADLEYTIREQRQEQ